MYYSKVFYEDKEIEDERLELTSKNTLYYLGRNLTLRNCTLVLKVAASNLFIRDVRFIDCVFDVKQELKNYQQWIRASLKGCRFKGRLTGCDFGHWPEYGNEPEHTQGALGDCDLSEARLHACRFMSCDTSTLRLPRWPCFTFLEPVVRAEEYRSAKWPGLVGDVIINDLHTNPERTRALTYHAPTVAERLETTPEELKAVIEKFDCILY